METLNHGIPKHNCFVIAQPPGPHKYSEMLGKQFVIQNPKKPDEQHKVELVDLWDWSIDTVPDTFCYIAYGLPKNKILPVLLAQYPLIQQKKRIHFYLLRKLD
jgi:hypothetical protein